jgi:hypothetical protein
MNFQNESNQFGQDSHLDNKEYNPHKDSSTIGNSSTTKRTASPIKEFIGLKRNRSDSEESETIFKRKEKPSGIPAFPSLNDSQFMFPVTSTVMPNTEAPTICKIKYFQPQTPSNILDKVQKCDDKNPKKG